MEQVYWSSFAREQGAELVTSLAAERVDAPDAVTDGDYTVLAGTGFKAYAQLRARLASGDRVVHEAALPTASDIALLARSRVPCRAGPSRQPKRSLSTCVIRSPTSKRPESQLGLSSNLQ